MAAALLGIHGYLLIDALFGTHSQYHSSRIRSAAHTGVSTGPRATNPPAEVGYPPKPRTRYTETRATNSLADAAISIQAADAALQAHRA